MSNYTRVQAGGRTAVVRLSLEGEVSVVEMSNPNVVGHRQADQTLREYIAFLSTILDEVTRLSDGVTRLND